MIDEELYQLATDELNSDKRDAKIWARACALASDDHDEARFLYTNLRVEELIAGREESGNQQHTGGQPVFDDTDVGATLSLDPIEVVDFSGTKTESPELTTAEYDSFDLGEMEDDQSTPSGVSLRSGVDSRPSGSLTDLDVSTVADSTMDRPISEPGAVQRLDDTDISLDLDPMEVERMNKAEVDDLSAFDGLPRKRSQAPGVSGSQALGADEELKWLDDKIRSEKNAIYLQKQHAQQQANALTQELERQAHQLPKQHSDIISDIDAAATQEVSANVDSEQPAMTDSKAIVGAAATISHDYSDSEEFDPDQLPIADEELYCLDAGGSTQFQVYSRADGLTKAVKDGVSWPALFFTLPWLLSRKLFGTAIVYLLLWLLIIAGLVSSGFTWMDAGETASTSIKAWTWGFGSFALIALAWVPFRYGNHWLRNKLERRGFEFKNMVLANNRKDAITHQLHQADVNS